MVPAEPAAPIAALETDQVTPPESPVAAKGMDWPVPKAAVAGVIEMVRGCGAGIW